MKVPVALQVLFHVVSSLLLLANIEIQRPCYGIRRWKRERRSSLGLGVHYSIVHTIDLPTEFRLAHRLPYVHVIPRNSLGGRTFPERDPHLFEERVEGPVCSNQRQLFLH